VQAGVLWGTTKEASKEKAMKTEGHSTGPQRQEKELPENQTTKEGTKQP